jgi:AcrR family transcriptional regulator
MIRLSIAMPRKSRYHHGDLREALVRAAADVIRKDGLEQLSLRALSRQLGVSEAAPYHHFKDKKALVAAVATLGFQALDERVAEESALGVATPAGRLVAFGRAYVRYAIEEPGLFRSTFGAHVVDMEVERDPAVSAVGGGVKSGTKALCADWLRETGSPLTVDGLFNLLWAVAHGVAWLYVEKEVEDTVRGPDAALAWVTEAVTRFLR